MGDRVKQIQSFADKDTERLWNRERIPPGNRLEALKGDRWGQFSIRINDQWRICFRWSAAGSEEVEIADYH